MRIGFVLAELSTGTANSLWPSVASMFPPEGNDTFVVFSGGRLNSSDSLERMRNSIYRFVTPENLDGAIIWGSSLTGNARSIDVLEHFRRMLPKPIVTIDGKTRDYPGIPDVRFDAYEGSRLITEHCIEKHGARRIAYIRGPENHNSAQERFRAYLDVLEKHGLNVDKSIISDPVPWESGDLAMRQILEKRKKLPGKDFDIIICASDLMLYRASLELSAHGFEIGRDVFACGFNDSLDSRLLNVPVTTVRLPYAGLGVCSVMAFRATAEGRRCEDKVLLTRPMFRCSCGCAAGIQRPLPEKPSEIAEIISEVYPIPADQALSMVENTLKTPTEENLRYILDSLCQGGADVFEIFEVLRFLDGMHPENDDRHEMMRDISAYILPSVLDRRDSIRRYEERSRRRAFGVFSNELLETNRITEIAEVLKRNSSSLGFEQIHIVVDFEDRSYLVGKNLEFSESALVPEGVKGILDSGTWVVAPLCTETESMGYLLMKPSSMNGQVCDDIRSAVSSALRSSMLFEATRRAQQAAENAEQARTTFFANVGEHLRDPLSEIGDIISASGLAPETRKAIIDRISGANNIIDLALGATNELELNRSMEDPGAILSSFGCYERTTPLPSLLVDGVRIRQALENIVTSVGSGARMRACVQRRGVHITITDTGGQWKAPKDDTGIALAQRIVILHNGTCSFGNGEFSVILPFPTLSGKTASVWEEGKTLAWIGKKPPFQVADADLEEDSGRKFAEKKRLSAETGAFYWDSGFKGYDALNALMRLVSNGTYRDLPVLCTDVPRSRTLEDSLWTSVEEKGKVILQVGPASEELFRWIQDPEVVSCDIGSAVAMAKRHEPELVIVSLAEAGSLIPEILALTSALKGMKRVSQIPVILCSDYLDEPFISAVSGIPDVIVVNSCMLESEEFAMRVRAILGGAEVLATNTGAIVKRAQGFICSHATLPVSRWQIADEVHVSEDYLTRIFKKELGLSPWDYLNRYRVWLACTLLKNTGMSVNDVAEATGFQDQAYFCRVFKKIRGYRPSRLRSMKKSEMSKMQ